jgi:hypothetical protein
MILITPIGVCLDRVNFALLNNPMLEFNLEKSVGFDISALP